jgi:hypothetical protein
MRSVKVFAVVVLGALASVHCTPNFATATGADVVLLMTGINNGVPLQSDVRLSNGAVCADFVTLRLENHFINPSLTNTGFRHDLTVFRYTVTYQRADGLNTPGVDIPFPISGDLAEEVREESDQTLPLEVVRLQAKLEPPLSNLAGLGGAQVLTMFANITLYARTTTGATLNPVTGALQIDFADFADTLTSCPAPPAGSQ